MLESRIEKRMKGYIQAMPLKREITETNQF